MSLPPAPGIPPHRLLALALLACLLPILLTSLLHLWSQREAAERPANLHSLSQVYAIEAGGLEPPVLLAGNSGDSPSAGQLPLKLPRTPEKRAVWLVLPFNIEEDVQSGWLLHVQHKRNLLVYVDGQLLAQTVSPEAIDVRDPALRLGSETLVATVPPSWLQRGPHLLQLRLGAAESPSVSSVHLGPPEALAALNQTRGVWFALRATTALSALVVGLFLVGIWLAHREALAYALAGGQLLFLALLLTPYLVHVQPLPSPWWRMLLDVADVLAKALLLATVVRLARPHDGWAMRVACVYTIVGALVDGAAAALDVPWNDFSQPWPWWALGSRLAVMLLAATLAVRSLLRQPRFDRLATASLVGLSLCIWTYVSFFALVVPQNWGVVDLNVVAHAAWVLWMGSLLYRHFVQTARRDRVMQQEAAQALAERTQELQASFVALQASESQRMAASERERLLQEMHDGLGSQLMTAKMNAQGGQLSAPEMVTALEVCIQEMRLAVDTLSVADGDLGLLLASVRHRAEPGLRAAGLTLSWQVAEAPCLPVLEGNGGRELVRIVQEALSNVLHHAGATRVTLRSEAAADGRHIVLSLIDNGRGLPAGQPPRGGVGGGGRGTRNMQQRAHRLHAQLSWHSPAGGGAPPLGGPGTEVRIELPVGRPG